MISFDSPNLVEPHPSSDRIEDALLRAIDDDQGTARARVEGIDDFLSDRLLEDVGAPPDEGDRLGHLADGDDPLRGDGLGEDPPSGGDIRILAGTEVWQEHTKVERAGDERERDESPRGALDRAPPGETNDRVRHAESQEGIDGQLVVHPLLGDQRENDEHRESDRERRAETALARIDDDHGQEEGEWQQADEAVHPRPVDAAKRVDQMPGGQIGLGEEAR